MNYEITTLLYATDFVATAGSCWGMIYTYNFQIDKNGNINVKFGIAQYDMSQPEPTKLLFEIVDNIKVPNYIIELYEYLIKSHLLTTKGNGACRLEKMEMFFEIVKNLKKSIKYMYDNPENIIDIHGQIKLFKHKNIILEDELQKMNTKIENIQKVYFDTLHENKLLKKKIQQLEIDIKKQKTRTIYVKIDKPEIDKPTIFTQSYTNSINTGTLPNASNRMVLNKFTGIYEPEDN